MWGGQSWPQNARPTRSKLVSLYYARLNSSKGSRYLCGTAAQCAKGKLTTGAEAGVPSGGGGGA